MAQVTIDILSRYAGEKGLKLAKKDVGGLEKSVMKLGKTLGAYVGARALYNLGKQSAKAFIADDKAARQLSTTLKNLGLAFQDTNVKDFISQTESLYGVLDDELRPAFQRLLTTTGSVAQSQKILISALDLSKATGTDLASTAQDLAQAYVGNTKGIKKYALGISQAELASMSFEDILKKITSTFGGSASRAADTYAGKVDRLKVSLANAQETLGKGIVDALTTISDDNTITNLTSQIDELAIALADAVRGVGNLANAFKKIPGLNGSSLVDFIQFIPIVGSYAAIAIQSGRNSRVNAMGANPAGGIGGSLSMQDRIKEANARKVKDAEAKAAKERAKQLALMKKQNQAQADALKTKKLGAIFDMQQIEVIAALQRKNDEETQKRLQLQLALLQDDLGAAEKLAKQLAAIQGQNSVISDYLQNLPDAKNPFEKWDIFLKGIEDRIARITGSNPSNGGGASGGGAGAMPKGTPTVPSLAGSTIAGGGDNIISGITPSGREYNFTANFTVGLEDGLVARQSQNYTADGGALSVKRNNPSWSLGTN